MRVVSIEGQENALGLPNSETYSLMSLNFFLKCLCFVKLYERSFILKTCLWLGLI